MAARWFDNRYPFIPFCILRPDWTGPLFEPLEGTMKSFPIYTVFGSRYELDKAIQHHWWNLERAIIYAYEEFLGLRPTFLHPLDIQVFRLPSSWGFTVDHESALAARLRALNSRNAFVPLMALLTYSIALSAKESAEPSELQPHWIRHLVEVCGVDAEWVNRLEQSVYCSLSAPRVGVYIDWETFTFPHLLTLYFRYHIPVWIRISETAFKNPDLPTSLRFRPTDHRTRVPPPIPLLVNTPPSRQRPQERIRDFISRMLRENGRRIEQESTEDRIKRLDRERNASRFVCPGPRGAYVFLWVDNQGYSVRTYVSRADVPDIWASYASTQKWYDSVHDQWDIGIELDPAATVDDDDYEDSDDWERPLSGDVYSSKSDEPILTFSELTRTRLQELYDATVLTTSHIETPDLGEMVFYRYGFHPDGSSYTPPTTILDESRIARILVNDDFPLVSHRQEALHFFSFLALKQPVPGSLHDLNDGNEIPLRIFKSGAFTFSKAPSAPYIITEPEKGVNTLQVPYASLVVEAFRTAACTTIRQLASYFVKRGTGFHLGRTLDDPFKALSGPHSGLGYRPKNYMPNMFDFKAYLDRRNQLLMDPSVAQSALMQGGIVWRLAVESLQSIYQDGVDFEAILFHDSDFVRLTQQDLGVIVGMYTIWTGKHPPSCARSQNLILTLTGEASVDKELSWWPQHGQWKQSNIDVLYWSNGCESWYQRRSHGILHGKLDVRSGRQWRQALTFFNQTGKVMEQNETYSLKFLQSLTHV